MRKIDIPISTQNVSMAVTELSLVVNPLAQRHFDLIASSKTCKLCFANLNQLQIWEEDTVSTVAQTRGTILDAAFSPFFANYIALVTDSGEAVVKDVTQSRATFHVAPSLSEGPKPMLKLQWHNSRQTVLATAYQDGLVCMWDMSIATQAPKSVVDGVTTLERPTSTGIVYPDSPELLVAMRSPEPLVDMTVAGDYVFCVGQSGVVRVFDAKRGEKLGEIADAAATRVVVVSEAPFVLATTSGQNNQRICLWRLQTASPLVFAMNEFFEFSSLPLPAGHPGHQSKFNLMRMASKNMITITHPDLAALWVLNVSNFSAITVGAPHPFNEISTHDPAEGFIAICGASVVMANFAGQDQQTQVPIVSEEILARQFTGAPTVVTVSPAPIIATSDVPESPSLLAAVALSPQPPTQGATNGNQQAAEPMITLDALRGILARQNQICLEGLRNNRALTLKKQLHVLDCLKHLPHAIMESLTPILESAAAIQKTRADTAAISSAVVEAVKEPASIAFGSYFKEALIPGYQKACHFMASDIQDAVDSAAKQLATPLVPVYTATVIDPLVQGLAQASGRLTQVYGKVQASVGTTGATSTANQSTSSTTSQTSALAPSSTSSKENTSSSSQNSSAHSAHTSSTDKPTPTASASSSSGATISSATASAPAAAAATPAKKKKAAAAAAVSSPAPAPAPVPSTAVPIPQKEAAPTSNNTSTEPSAPPAEQIVTPVTPPPPRPDPKVTTPISEALRNQLSGFISQKQWSDAVNLILDQDNVEALGFLTSRADMATWVDYISNPHLEVLLFMILKQTEWPSPSQLAKYKKTVLLILKKLDPFYLSNSPTTHEMLQSAGQWIGGTPDEAIAKEDIQRIVKGLPK